MPRYPEPTELKSIRQVIEEAHEAYRNWPEWLKVQAERNITVRKYYETLEEVPSCNHCGRTIGKYGCLSCYP